MTYWYFTYAPTVNLEHISWGIVACPSNDFDINCCCFKYPIPHLIYSILSVSEISKEYFEEIKIQTDKTKLNNTIIENKITLKDF